MSSSPLLISPLRGRPQKYGRPARAITVTLPEDILETLSATDADLGRAIVKLVERRGKSRADSRKPAEIATYGSRSVIVVPEARALRKLAGVQLVPIGNGRCLIALEPPYSIPQLELDIRDLLAQGRWRRPSERRSTPLRLSFEPPACLGTSLPNSAPSSSWRPVAAVEARDARGCSSVPAAALGKFSRCAKARALSRCAIACRATHDGSARHRHARSHLETTLCCP